ncbi:carbonic anhydrase 1-like [Mya arenaria]|uniref:carbonic anhydrase 1-like n=1 Tax=Mya arenaria TaxID=6604 RepID=UPI0022E54111|nr:carbonic anhydrase 1-like [Mya arenaria]
MAKLMFGVLLIWTLLIKSEASNWGYVEDRGPNHWADLFPDACSGQQQSPIDIRTQETIYDPGLKDFAVFFDPPMPGSRFFVHNNGHSIQVNTEGRFYVSNGGLPDIYSTAQFHFHWGHQAHHGSEHTVDGIPAPIEMHIVNWNSDRFASIGEAATEPAGLAVLGILFEISPNDNPILEPIVNVLTHVRDPDMKLKAEIPAVSMRTYLPRAHDRYYRYNGSLTTPGCFESVVWTVFHEKQTISKRQLHVFRSVLKPSNHHRGRRSLRSRGIRRFVDEVGINGNFEETERLRRQLEAKATQTDGMAAAEDVVVYEEPPKQPMQNLTTTPTTRHHSNHKPHEAKPEPISALPGTGAHDINMTKAEQVRKMLVNNYRPVQPLNGRVVFRSFPFFNEPIKQDTEVVYIDIHESEKGGSSFIVGSFTTILCSVLILRIW